METHDPKLHIDGEEDTDQATGSHTDEAEEVFWPCLALSPCITRKRLEPGPKSHLLVTVIR